MEPALQTLLTMQCSSSVLREKFMTVVQESSKKYYALVRFWSIMDNVLHKCAESGVCFQRHAFLNAFKFKHRWILEGKRF